MTAGRQAGRQAGGHRFLLRTIVLGATAAALAAFGFAQGASALSVPLVPNTLPCNPCGGGYYWNPFYASTGLVLERTDQGVDYKGYGAISAIGAGVVESVRSDPGWFGYYLLYKLTAGPFSGDYVYVAEGIVPRVSAGAHVSQGQEIATFSASGEPTGNQGIETGWGSSFPDLSLYTHLCGAYSDSYGQTSMGRAFARFLISIGTPVEENPGSGPEYTTACAHYGP